jgi:hypothetical protein
VSRPSPTSVTTSACRERSPGREVAELVEAGALAPARVEGCAPPPTSVRRRLRAPAREARALLTPFDSLVWSRPRTERVFGFRYRMEMYTPARSGATGTTCSRSSSATASWRGSTSRGDRPAGVLRVLGAIRRAGGRSRRGGAGTGGRAAAARRVARARPRLRARTGDLAGRLATAVSAAQGRP